MYWFEILVLAGLIIIIVILATIFDLIEKFNKRLVDVDESIKTNCDGIKHNLSYVYKGIEDTRTDMNKHLNNR